MVKLVKLFAAGGVEAALGNGVTAWGGIGEAPVYVYGAARYSKEKKKTLWHLVSLTLTLVMAEH